MAQRLGTSGTRRQVEDLEQERQQFVDQIEKREEWVEDHADVLHTYTAIKDELSSRATALAISYQLRPPEDVLKALGPRPADTIDATRSDTAVIHHAAARISLGSNADLTDPSIVEAASWRTAIDGYHPQPGLERGPALRMVG